MICPVCSHGLRLVRVRNTTVKLCPSCKGIWFDAEQFTPFAKNLAQDEQIEPKKTQLFTCKQVVPAGKVVQEHRICPRCSVQMRTFNYAYDSNILLERCGRCGGIWTDTGEIRRVASYLKNDPRIDEIGKYLTQKNQTLDDLAEMGELFSKPVPSVVLFLPKIIIPIGDDQSRSRFPYITVSLIIVCIAAFVRSVIPAAGFEKIVYEYGFVPAHFFGVGLVTSMFLHAGIVHLLGNMYFLWLFGDNVEDRLGYFKFVIFYLLAGLAANFLHAVVNSGSTIPAIGASGAISGVMGAYVMFYPYARIRVFFIYRVIELSAVFYLGSWFAFQLLYGFLDLEVGVSNVARFAHIGGFAFGMVTAYLVKVCCKPQAV